MAKKSKASGRKKKNGASIADQKNQRRALAAPIQKANPFEKRKLKRKHVVVGQRLKSEESLGQARTAALEERKRTLLVELQQRENVNAFIDRRIGEQDESLSHEEKMLARYQKEKQKKLLKKSLFSLNDTEESLTHLGQSLSELNSYDDFVGSDDDEDVEGEIVSDYHFGGGIFQKVEGGPEGRNREEIMKEVVAKSKYYKHMHQREREENIALTEELDDNLEQLFPHLAGMWKNKGEREAGDEFDMLTRELAFEARAKPLDRLPTAEEIAQKQRDRLEFLEKERIRRMRGEVSEEEDEEAMEEAADEESALMEDGEESSDEEDDEMDSDEEESEEEGASRKNKNKGKKKKNNKKKDAPKPLTEKELRLIENSLQEENAIPFLIPVPESFPEMQRLLHGRSSAQLRTIMARMVASNNATLGPTYKKELERMFTLTLQYFDWLIDDVTVSSDASRTEHGDCMDILSTALFNVLPSVAPLVVPLLKERLIRMHQRLDESLLDLEGASGDQTVAPVWKLSDLYFLKLVANLFPVSDFRHPIITPALLLMNRLLVYLPVHSHRTILTKLFVSSLIYHYVQPTQRFVPEVMSFLHLVLLGAMNQRKHPLFTSATRQMTSLLQVTKKWTKRERKQIEQYSVEPINLRQALTSEEPNPVVGRYQVLFAALTLVGQFATLYENYESYVELFTPWANLLRAMDKHTLPRGLKELAQATCRQLDSHISTELAQRKPLLFKELKPVPLRSLAPNFIEEYIPGRDYDKDQERARMRALKKKVKAEKKGAMRELKKDSIFIENERMKKRLQEDEERKEKLKGILSSLEQEQHHYNVAKKKNKKVRS